MKRAALVSALAFLLTVAGAAPAHADDTQPTPAPLRTLPAATPTKPPFGVGQLYRPGSTCTDWYLQTNYADSWPTTNTWWEAQCNSYFPECWPYCYPDETPSNLIDLYYWDGSQGVFYGEHDQDYYGGGACEYWWDAAAALFYQYDVPGCPWTGPGNAAPVGMWGYNCSLLDCTFDGSGSFASDGIASYEWDFGDGARGSGPTAQHSFAAKGFYRVTLTVTDNGGLVAARSNTMSPQDLLPIASFTYACTDRTCTFDASASYDPDGAIEQYSWSFDGPWVTGAVTMTHTFSQPGAHTVRLYVVDDGGFYAYSSQDLVIAGDPPPVASFTVACSALRCHLDASASSDPDGTIVEYDWTFVDANNATATNGVYSPTLDRTFPHDGTWVVSLSVLDNLGVRGTSTSQTVTLTDLPPTAAFTWSCTVLDCSFDGGASTDPDGIVRSYSWNFGDGASATTATAQHTYANAGTYTVTLSVTDDGGLTGIVSKSVTVVATMPTASFSVTCAAGACTFDASSSTDVGGTITGYAWTFGDGATGQGKVVSHTYAAAGTYTITLTVTDSGGVTASTSKPASSIKLSASVAKVKNQRQVSLSWSGSNSATYDVYRNGVWITTVVGASFAEAFTKPGTYTYTVCEANKSICSNSVTVNV